MNFFVTTIGMIILCVANVKAEETRNIELPYASSYTLNCSNVTSPSWYLKNITANTITQINTGGKYIVAGAQLTINDLRSPELTAEFYCNSSSGAIVFKPLPVPHLYGKEKDSITVTEGGYTKVQCKMIVGFQQNQTIKWTWMSNNAILTETPDRVEIVNSGTNNSTSELTFRKITLADKGPITCVVTNGASINATQEFQLRVKNTLAALWPFLAIIGEVIILCIIILIFEKKCTKKSTTSEDEAENLMNKQKDNNNSDLKKRAVKA